MPDRELRIRARVIGGQQVRGAFNGIVRDGQRAERKQRAESQATTQSLQRELRKREQEQKKAARDDARAFATAEELKRRAARRTLEELRRGRRGRARDSVQGGRGAAFAAGVGSFVGASASNAFSAALGELTGQVQAVSDRLRAQAGALATEDVEAQRREIQAGIVRIGNQAFGDLGDEDFNRRIEETRQRIDEVQAATGVAPGELVDGLIRFQEEFSAFDQGLGSLDALAQTSVALGVPFRDLVGVLGQAQQQFGLTADEAGDFFAVLAQQGRQGSVNPAQFAGVFSRSFGQFSQLTGRQGLDAFREFGALAQVQARGGGTTAEAETRNRAFFRSLGDRNVRQRLARAGVRVTDEGGSVRDIGSIIGEIASSQRFRTRSGGVDVEALGRVFTESEARAGVQTLIANQGLIGEIQGAQTEDVAGAGRGLLAAATRRTLGTDIGQARLREAEIARSRRASSEDSFTARAAQVQDALRIAALENGGGASDLLAGLAEGSLGSLLGSVFEGARRVYGNEQYPPELQALVDRAQEVGAAGEPLTATAIGDAVASRPTALDPATIEGIGAAVAANLPGAGAPPINEAARGGAAPQDRRRAR